MKSIYRQLCLTMFKLTCGWAPPPLRPVVITHAMIFSQALVFHHSSASMYYCESKSEEQNGVGQGTRLPQPLVFDYIMAKKPGSRGGMGMRSW